MASIWDLYLDVDDAADLLRALEVMERHRAVREPLPLSDPPRLLERLRIVAGIAAEEAGHWENEAQDRRLEADVDGGSWGSVETARRMAAVAEGLAAGSREIARTAQAAAQDVAGRLPGPGTVPPAVQAAEDVTAREVQDLLARHPRKPEAAGG